MNEEIPHVCEFGKFRLNTQKKTLWHDGISVPMPLKELELLCVLIENRGELVTKEELLNKVWEDSFVEESNLSRHIYLLRQTFKEFGESEDLIQNVPRRGYRFTGDIGKAANGEVIIEKHTSTRTLIEIQDDGKEKSITHAAEEKRHALTGFALSHRLILSVSAIAAILLTGIFFFRNYPNFQSKVSVLEIKSVAVLPVKSFSDGAGDDELRLRITDALITRLGHLDRIAVRPTSAVLPFVKAEQDALEVGKELRVDAVIDSRIQQEGERLRVTIQLLKVATGEQLWSEQFDGQANQILDLQDMIAAKVVQSLDTEASQQKTMVKRPTDNSDAYEAYLKARYFWSKRDEASLRQAIEYFNQAIALDPKFAEAYSGLADTQHLLFNYNIEVTPEIIVQAKENLRRALELKPDSADALTTLGTIQMGYDWDWQRAEESLKLATAAEPNSPTAHMRYGALLVRLGRFVESQAEFEKGIELDPLSLVGNMNLGLVYFCKKDFAAADTQYRKTLEIDGKAGATHWLLSRVLWQESRKDEAVREIIRALELDGNTTLAEKLLTKSNPGQPVDAIRQLLFAWRNNPPGTNPHNLAYLSTYVDDREKAMFWIEKSVAEHHPWTTWVFAAPEFETLRDIPRFQAILRELKFVE